MIQAGIVRKSSLSHIQTSIGDELDAVLAEMEGSVSHDVPLVAQMGRHLMGMRGKMFRPTLVLLCADADGMRQPQAIPLAAAVELIHLATLVHDDAVDHSVLRRGMPTLNSLFSHQISVIMGDFLYSTALGKLVAAGDLAPLRALTRASTEMSVGELRQLAVADHLSFSEKEYFDLIRSKTASLMSAACEVGAMCGASRFREPLIEYGEMLGMAFQIVDDLIDYTEQEATTGKPTGLDLREHKVTLPLIAALREMTPGDRATVKALFEHELPDDTIVAEVIALVAGNGGLAYARERGSYFAGRALDALSVLPDSVARGALIESISYVMERHA